MTLKGKATAVDCINPPFTLLFEGVGGRKKATLIDSRRQPNQQPLHTLRNPLFSSSPFIPPPLLLDFCSHTALLSSFFTTLYTNRKGFLFRIGRQRDQVTGDKFAELTPANSIFRLAKLFFLPNLGTPPKNTKPVIITPTPRFRHVACACARWGEKCATPPPFPFSPNPNHHPIQIQQ